jgi:hypothetical protein
MSKSKPPFVVRWRNGVMDDPNPALTWNALVAAMALVRHADVTTGRNCYPGATTCARQMRVSVDTIQRGWAELKEAGWLEIAPLPASRRQTHGALKVLRFPKAVSPADSGYPLTAPTSPADSGSTIPGNQGVPSGPSEEAPHPGKRCGKHPDVELYEGTCYECEREAYNAHHGVTA